MGAWFGRHWWAVRWPPGFVADAAPSMTYLELVPLLVACEVWGADWQGRRVLVWSDNMGVVGCVARGLSAAFLVADLPFQSDATPERALDASTRCLQAGAQMVKLEGAGPKLEVIRFLAEREIPVCAHLGLTPQSVLRLGDYRVQGREAAAAKKLLADARAVAEAGADLLVLECVPSGLAQAVTVASPIPTIGIGAGPHCDGQVLVLHDMLGLDGGHRRPKFVKDFLAEGGSVAGAVRAYCEAVRSGEFPDGAHAYE